MKKKLVLVCISMLILLGLTGVAGCSGKSYSVIYETGGGTTAVSFRTVRYGWDYILDVPYLEGAAFLGWYTSAEKDSQPLTDRYGKSLSSYSLQSDSMVYAHWELFETENLVYSPVLSGEGYAVSAPHEFSAKYLRIPAAYKGLPVLEISAFGFADILELHTVELPNTLEKIGASAFSGCEEMVYFRSSASVKEIGQRAFYECKSLLSFSFSSDISYIGMYAFSGCVSLGELDLSAAQSSFEMDKYAFSGCTAVSVLKLPAELSVIPEYAFSSCSSLKELRLENALQKVEVGAFAGCSALRNVKIGKSLRYLGELTFDGCTYLSDISIEEDNEFFAVEGNILFSKDKSVLYRWADKQGRFIREFVEGGVSGFKVSASNRDAIIEIKAMADRQEFDILGVYMSDRLGRIADETPLIVSYLNARGIKVISFCEGEISAKTHTDKLLTYIKYWQAEAESIKNSERITHAMEQSVKEGKWRGGNPPYGYRTVSRGTLNFKGKPVFDVIIDPEASKVVKEIFNLYKRHYGLRSIAKNLNDNVPKQRGGIWTSGIVRDILKNKLYIGIYELGKKSKIRMKSPVMEHLRLIPDQDFNEVQELLKKNSNYPVGNRPTVRGSKLLTGLLFCECGEKYTSQTQSMKKQRKDGSVWIYERTVYRCGSFRSKGAHCNKKSLVTDMLDKLVIEETKRFILELVNQKPEYSEDLKNWAVNFDAQDTMGKKEILIDLIDKILIRDEIIEITYKIDMQDNGQWEIRI